MPGDETGNRVALVRRAYDVWNRDGVGRFAEFLSADVTIEDAPEGPDAGIARGSAEVVRRLDEVARTVGGGSVQIRGIEEIGDAVLVTMIWNLDTSGGEQVDLGEVFHLVEVDGNEISRIRVFLNRRSAAGAM